MPNPKRKHSKTRTAKRRANHGLRAKPTSSCDHCGEEMRLPHRICIACGHYNKNEIIEGEEE